jgi:hypothetical protein
MADITGGIGAGGNLLGQAFFHQLADMKMVGFGIGTFFINGFGHINSWIRADLLSPVSYHLVE